MKRVRRLPGFGLRPGQPIARESGGGKNQDGYSNARAEAGKPTSDDVF